jgi:hypothetical protein
VPYLKRAIRSVGRAPASKRPALKALIRKRAKALGALNSPGVKGTWPFQAANDGAAVQLAGQPVQGGSEAPTYPAKKMPMLPGPADLTAHRTGNVTSKSTGMLIGTGLGQQDDGSWSVKHVSGKTATGGSSQAALASLYKAHNNMVSGKTADLTAGEQLAFEFAVTATTTPAVAAGDGPRITTMGGAGKAVTVKTAAGKITAQGAAVIPDDVKAIYTKLVAKGMKPRQALLLAKRAARRAKTAA